jgi:hypothetical protein
MMTPWRVLAIIAMVAFNAAASATQPATLIVIATMHGLHKNHAGYNYDQLYALVRDLRPDFVGVEIRPEDMARDADYLKRNYPAEMLALAQEYGARSFGFDWLGEAIAGQPVPVNWWKERDPIKRLEREQDGDPKYQDTPAMKGLDAKLQDLLAHATAVSLNDGQYDELVEQRYAEIRRLLAPSPYAAIPKFYAERDEHLCRNVVHMIRANPGKRFVVATGADHRFAMVKCVPRMLGGSVTLVNIEAGLSPTTSR